MDIILNRWKRLALASLVALIVGFGANFYYLSHIHILPVANADQRDKWEGQIEEKVRAGENRDRAIFDLIGEIRKEFQDGKKEMMIKIDSICSDITVIKVQAAQNGVLYGGGAGGIVLVILQLIQFLAKKRNKNNGK